MEPSSGGAALEARTKFAIEPSSACGVAANTVGDNSATSNVVRIEMRFIILSLPSYLSSAGDLSQYVLRRLLRP